MCYLVVQIAEPTIFVAGCSLLERGKIAVRRHVATVGHVFRSRSLWSCRDMLSRCSPNSAQLFDEAPLTNNLPARVRVPSGGPTYVESSQALAPLQIPSQTTTSPGGYRREKGRNVAQEPPVTAFDDPRARTCVSCGRLSCGSRRRRSRRW